MAASEAENIERPEDDEQAQRNDDPSEHGAEAYGGDPDAGPSVSEDEVQAGLERDQAEG